MADTTQLFGINDLGAVVGNARCDISGAYVAICRDGSNVWSNKDTRPENGQDWQSGTLSGINSSGVICGHYSIAFNGGDTDNPDTSFYFDTNGNPSCSSAMLWLSPAPYCCSTPSETPAALLLR